MHEISFHLINGYESFSDKILLFHIYAQNLIFTTHQALFHLWMKLHDLCGFLKFNLSSEWNFILYLNEASIDLWMECYRPSKRSFILSLDKSSSHSWMEPRLICEGNLVVSMDRTYSFLMKLYPLFERKFILFQMYTWNPISFMHWSSSCPGYLQPEHGSL